ncbi:MAG: beta-propeller fold lactonase family protein [Actinomycetota bacterium]|nr:beta-propeller fold lactonase family protein [Actinomycetota bacterium]
MVCGWLVLGAFSALAASPLFTAVPGSPFATGRAPSSVAFNSSGGLLATSDLGPSAGGAPPGLISMFSVGSDGALTELAGSPTSTGAGPTAVAFSPSGALLATPNFQQDNGTTVSVFSVASGGGLTPVAGSPFTTDSVDAPHSLAFSPSGSLLATSDIHTYAGAPAPGKVSMFSVAADGSLTQVTGSPFDNGASSAFSIAFSPSGHLLATTDYSTVNGGAISVFSVASDGSLTPIPGSPYLTPSGAGAKGIAFSPSGGLLAVTNDGGLGNTVSVYSVASDGSLTQVSGSPYPTGGFPESVAFSPTGTLLATADQDSNTVSVFSVSSSGQLTPVAGSPYATGGGPGSVAFSPSGLLATADTGGNTVSVFAPTASGSPVPVITAGPTITGQPVVGQTLTEVHGTWTGSPASYSYTWKRCNTAGTSCSTISTAPTYTVTTADLGDTIIVLETASNAGGASVPASSAPTATVTKPSTATPPTDLTSPTISGRAVVGATLTEGHGTWTGSPTRFGYTWKRCNTAGTVCVTVSDARSYTVRTADLGSTILVLETAYNAFGASSPASSFQTATVTKPSAAKPPANTEPPAITGHAVIGQKLTESHGRWTSGRRFSYKWYACRRSGEECTVIPGATGRRFRLTVAVRGDEIRVRETAYNKAGASAPRRSAATKKVR